MDGSKKQLNKSIQFWLSVYLSAAILLVAVVTGALSFVFAFDEAHELQDESLRQTASLIDHVPSADEIILVNGNRGSDADSDLLILNLNPVADPVLFGLPDGLHTLDQTGAKYRAFIRTLPDLSRIALLQKTELRDEIANDSAIRTLLPLLVLVPILILLVTWLVQKIFRPIGVLAREIDSRGDLELHAVPEKGLPQEIQPFVHAINRLFERVAQSVQAQQRFLADAAHELRSPIAALSLQAERLEACELNPEARERIIRLQKGIDRSRRLLGQLLSMARAQSNPVVERGPISLLGVCTHVLEDALPMAQAKGIDLGMGETTQDAVVHAEETEVLLIVRNLVDNAIRYNNAGGVVDLGIHHEMGWVVFTVEDNGPGIAQADRQRVFDPFFRVSGLEQTGSGLGLAIVKGLVDRFDGKIELHDSARFASGLVVKVFFNKHPKP
ncbi:MAG: two-component sensor histidine kinase [Gammaproteobacteria bacterium]|nr:two-component sensor histidine kinase [Gammaproteobacteria bacterium]MBU0849160.1 two-component sensor histidine kinase [Gammaproteobacteria bacterium]MBU1267911.1 two-component sensor histidine kinase [Gammaproteobacteria bacterium]MBU1528334.1 two-component sensor histidine kinase [Gammaproteobacteria bacterium]MBU1781497.1 two-component sensor histidine kinase [Gammaproteobacteria bacterium]